jgi:hypothetical protein
VNGGKFGIEKKKITSNTKMRTPAAPKITFQLLAHLRNVIALFVAQPKFLVRRRDRNSSATVIASMTEKQLYKKLRELGLITYIDVRTTEIDKLVKKDDFQRSLRIFQRGDDGLLHELNRT